MGIGDTATLTNQYGNFLTLMHRKWECGVARDSAKRYAGVILNNF